MTAQPGTTSKAQSRKAPGRPGHGSQIITALEDAWRAIQARHPEVPACVMITGHGTQQKGTVRGRRLRGHHWPARWVTREGDRLPELFVAGEDIRNGAIAVLEVLLHEAAHALATVRGIRDTSAAGHRYHNRRYVALAVELGLGEPGEPDKVTGFENCPMTEATAAAYAKVIAAIDAARLPYLDGQGAPEVPANPEDPDENPGDETPEEDKKRSGSRTRVTCQCPEPRALSITPKQLDVGPIVCGLCNEPFTPAQTSAGESQEGT
jgi:hypothetical protein